ncbi:DUF1460 domain-containing protein [Kovacikia minuta CCNUW1]|uniref:N-acetylmuramoyl-L-alanine amidase-like domain-containing protein n=1 Tax=Kovacikia minuta TaxID=2931930 RepID=UPI001CC9378F|nr:N-acetylmuramoyl-L-alanine amidase-like domain-containing protein [Kovacikia minuta]UBF24548.1 DUF1460 domain-containing protein [Kovacikia minuta CCNUW1]
MRTLLKVATGVVWTLGFVICSPLNASLPGHSKVLSNPLEPTAPKSVLPSDSNPEESVNSLERSTASTSLSIRSGGVDFDRKRFPVLWSQAETVPLNQSADASVALEGNRFRSMMQTAIGRSLYRLSMGEIVQTISQQLLGSSYHPDLLDRSQQETLVVSLSQFDCVLFVETVLALAKGIANQDYSYPTFTDYLQNQRYRDGELNGYCSRLHYFSEWIANNQQRGNVTNLTPELGGVVLRKPLNFMSNHRSSYPRLMNDEATYQCVRQMETRLQSLTLSYIPTNRIHRIYAYLKPGDIVAIATNTAGLDVTHTGLVYRGVNGDTGLIHAVPKRGVKISPDLQTYVSQVDAAIGILVARVVDPRV